MNFFSFPWEGNLNMTNLGTLLGISIAVSMYEVNCLSFWSFRLSFKIISQVIEIDFCCPTGFLFSCCQQSCSQFFQPIYFVISPSESPVTTWLLASTSQLKNYPPFLSLLLRQSLVPTKSWLTLSFVTECNLTQIVPILCCLNQGSKH